MSNKENPFFIGIDIGGTNIQAGVVGASGKIMQRKSGPTLVHEGKNRVIERICNFITELIENIGSGSVIGIGIGSAGVIDIERGVVVTSPNFPDWKDVPLKEIISSRYGITTVLDNDANVVVYGEYLVGAARGASSLIGLTLGTGVGGAIILDGNIWHGCEGMAGEIGHITVVPDGPECVCGNFGCLEAYASATAIVKHTLERLSNTSQGPILRSSLLKDFSDLTSTKIYEAALLGDGLAKEVFAEAGMYLGIALGSLINIFNPEQVVIGGGVINAWDFFYSSLREEVNKRAFARPAKRVDILPAVLGEDAGIIGAAGLAAGTLGYEIKNRL